MIRTLAAVSRLTIRRSALRCQKMNPKFSLVVDSSLVNSYKFALIHTSPLVYKKSGGSKKSKKGSSLDDLLDELSDDEDDTSAQKQPAIASINPNSPVSKFLKDQVKGKGKGKGLSVTNEDVSFMDMDAFWKEMESILQAQKEHFMQHITLRSASAIDEIQVEFEGETYPLREIADISKADPKRIIIDSSAIPQATKIIIQALQSKKTMNLNPQQEGTRIYVPVPKVTKETRMNLAKSAQMTMNDTLEKFRKFSNKKIGQLNDAYQSGVIKASEDQVKGAEQLIRAIESNFIHLAKEMSNQKQKDLMNK